jgi:hypothetical protein
MSKTPACRFLPVCTALLCAGAASAASLDTWVGVVGGAGNGNIGQGCTTYGPPAGISFFTSNGFGVPLGGITACGYSGSVTQTTAGSGPLTLGGSLSPVLLGNPGYSGSFDGTAAAVADFGRLGADAHANISGGIPGSPTALFESFAAARFTDTLTATSPLAANGSAGFIRYAFSIDGLSTSLGAPGPYLFGETLAVLDVQQDNGPVYGLLNASIRRGETGTINNGAPPAGWTTSMGSLAGGSTFYSLDLPMVWGQAFDLSVGLMAFAYGTADSDFLHTAQLSGVTLMDANHVPLSNFSLTAASGTDYVNAVPEPASVAMLLAGLVVTGWCGMRRASRAN